jgi:aminopeptidase YwaD
LCIESPPLASASFTPYLLEEVVTRAFSQCTNPAGTSGLPSIRMQTTPFSGGSDHFILSDPTVGVPTPMLMQWPDKYYHTSGDTIEKVSSETMRRMVVAASTYAYTCALASEGDLMWLLGLTGRGLRKWVIDEWGKFANSEGPLPVEPGYKAEFVLRRGKEALRSVAKLLPCSRRLRARTKVEERLLGRVVRGEAGASSGAPRRRIRASVSSVLGERAETVYRRPVPGPVDMGAVLMEMGTRWKARYGKWLEKEKAAYVMQPLAQYWMDGRRSTEEVCRLIAAETGHASPEFLSFYVGLLEEAGVVEAAEA